ncbi:MAG: VWA domain-containing protein [Blastocatellia bacterium]|nr:VWA domain-containing protein [Blastocatellia bacterium]
MKKLTTLLLFFFSLAALDWLASTALCQDDVIKIETDLVLINATVVDNSGRYVSKLKVKDFTLKEDGVKREISHFAAEETPFAAAILIDTSTSMKTRLSRARVAASQFADNLRGDDVVSIYSFNTSVEMLQEFSSERELSPKVLDMDAHGQTRLYDCMYEALEALSTRQEQRKAVILISDGEDTKSYKSAEDALKLALKLGVTIYTIDIAEAAASRDGSQLRAAQIMKNLAEKTGGQYIKSIGGQTLAEKIVDISVELRSQYTIGFYPEKRDEVKWHKLTLEVNKENVRVRARQGY